MSRHAQVPEGVLDLTPTQIKVYAACSILRDFRTDLSDATTTQIAETARVDHRACRRALQALEAIGWLTTVTPHTTRRAAVRRVESDLREGAVVTSLRGRHDPLQRGLSDPPPHRDPEKDARASGAEPHPPAYPQEHDVPDDPGLFDEPAQPARKPRSTKTTAEKTGAPRIVAEYAERYLEVHGRPAFSTSKDKIGREARSKLNTGACTQDELIEAVRALAETEYENLDVEVKKLRQAKARHDAQTGASAGGGWQPAPALTPEQAEEAQAAYRERIHALMRGEAS